MSQYVTPEKLQADLLSDNKLSIPRRKCTLLNSFDSKEWNYITPQKPPMRAQELELFSYKRKHIEDIKNSLFDDFASIGNHSGKSRKETGKIASFKDQLTMEIHSSSKSRSTIGMASKHTPLTNKMDDLLRNTTPHKRLLISLPLPDKNTAGIKINNAKIEEVESIPQWKSGQETKPRCTCKKSKCIKLYCECFKAGTYCSHLCFCINCKNNHQHEGLRNLIFEEKAKNSSFGAICCHCKTGCKKKYCECLKEGVKCNIHCRCFLCLNC